MEQSNLILTGQVRRASGIWSRTFPFPAVKALLWIPRSVSCLKWLFVSVIPQTQSKRIYFLWLNSKWLQNCWCASRCAVSKINQFMLAENLWRAPFPLFRMLHYDQQLFHDIRNQLPDMDAPFKGNGGLLYSKWILLYGGNIRVMWELLYSFIYTDSKRTKTNSLSWFCKSNVSPVR